MSSVSCFYSHWYSGWECTGWKYWCCRPTYRSGDVKSSLLELTKQEYDKLVQAKPSSFPRCRNGGNKQDTKAKQMMVVRWHWWRTQKLFSKQWRNWSKLGEHLVKALLSRTFTKLFRQSPKNVCIKSNQNKIYWILWGESILQIIFCYSGLRRQQQLGDEKVLCWGKSLTAICSPQAGRSQCLPRGFNLTHKWGEHDLPLIAKLQLFQISRLIWTLSTTTIQINLGNVGQLAFSHWI